jgi:transcriptional regulator with XRE-family HTH domain
MAPPPQGVRLAKRLRGLRESVEPNLTQAQLARALSGEARVAVATISSWESPSNPKLPPVERLRTYAQFFCTDRSLDGDPHLVPERELTQDERERFSELTDELLELRDAVRAQGAHLGSPAGGSYTWDFESGRITIICPAAPADTLPSLASEHDPNYTRMYRYADLDALIELFGHLRASNPELDVRHRLPSEVVADDLSGHLVLLGGVGWNAITRRLLTTLSEMPIAQFEAPDVQTGEIFRASGKIGSERIQTPVGRGRPEPSRVGGGRRPSGQAAEPVQPQSDDHDLQRRPQSRCSRGGPGPDRRGRS